MTFQSKIVSNTLWSVGGQISYSSIQLGANIIYARFLGPDDFGQLGIVMFFILLSNVLVEGGLGGALIRKKNASEIDYTTVFILNLILSISLYLLLIIFRKSIAIFYNEPILTNIIILAGAVLIFNSLNFVQNTRLVKNLKFRQIAIYKFSALLIAQFIGITTLIIGYGIWSMIIAIVMNPLIFGIILWAKEGSIGKLAFSIKSFKELYKFGFNTTIASIIDTIFNNIYQLILGKFFSITEVGFFYQAKKLQDVPNYVIYGTTNSVIYSSLAQLQDDKQNLIRTYNKIISYFSIAIGLMVLISTIYSKEIIYLLFGEKWVPASIYLIILASAAYFYVHEMFNRVIFKIFNKTDQILKLELIKKSIFIVTIIIGLIVMDIKVLLVGYLIASFISYVINYFMSCKIMRVDKWGELKYILKIFIATVAIFAIFSSLKSLLNPGIGLILLFIPFSILSYYFCLKLIGVKINLEEMKYLKSILLKPGSKNPT